MAWTSASCGVISGVCFFFFRHLWLGLGSFSFGYLAYLRLMARGSLRPGRFRTKCDPAEWISHATSTIVSRSAFVVSSFFLASRPLSTQRGHGGFFRGSKSTARSPAMTVQNSVAETSCPSLRDASFSNTSCDIVLRIARTLPSASRK